jgi:phage regulator Rha-like protein
MPRKPSIALALPEKDIVNRIFFIRGQKVMIDRDLAEMYGVETKVMKQAVRRNLSRFPQDFMFEMTSEELENWRSQIVTSNSDKMGLRYAPFCFTEQGVAMLSSVLNSETAIQVNIQIIRVFASMKQLLMDNKDLQLKMEQLEKVVSKHDKEIPTYYRTTNTKEFWGFHVTIKNNKKTHEILAIFNAVKKLIEQPAQPRNPIGFPYPGKK